MICGGWPCAEPKIAGRTGGDWVSDTKEKKGRMDTFIAAWWARFEFRVLYLLSRGALCQNMAARRTSLFPGFPVSAPFCTGKGHVCAQVGGHLAKLPWSLFVSHLQAVSSVAHPWKVSSWLVWAEEVTWTLGALSPLGLFFSIPWGGMRLVEDNRAPQKGSVEGSTPLGQRLYYKGKY